MHAAWAVKCHKVPARGPLMMYSAQGIFARKKHIFDLYGGCKNGMGPYMG